MEQEEAQEALEAYVQAILDLSQVEASSPVNITVHHTAASMATILACGLHQVLEDTTAPSVPDTVTQDTLDTTHYMVPVTGTGQDSFLAAASAMVALALALESEAETLGSEAETSEQAPPNAPKA